MLEHRRRAREASAVSHFSTTGEVSLDKNACIFPSKFFIYNTTEEGKSYSKPVSASLTTGAEKVLCIFNGPVK